MSATAQKQQTPIMAQRAAVAGSKARLDARLMVTYSGPESAQTVVDELQRVGLPSFAEVLFIVPKRMISIPPRMRRPGLFPAPWFPRVQSLPGVGLVANEAAQAARAWGADLIVVGSQGSARVDPPYYACGAASLAELAHCSVRIARTQAHGPGAAPRLVIGIDGSPDADSAVHEVSRRAWPGGARVRLVTVRECNVDVGRMGALVHPGAALSRGAPTVGDATAALSRAEASLRAAGLDVSTEIRRGDPVDELLTAARAWGANCILIGARGLGDVRRAGATRGQLGGVARLLAERAPLSVEVVRGGGAWPTPWGSGSGEATYRMPFARTALVPDEPF